MDAIPSATSLGSGNTKPNYEAICVGLVAFVKGRAPRYGLSHADQEDVVQDAILIAIQAASRLNGTLDYPRWICGVAINVMRRARRQRENIARSAPEAEWGERPDPRTPLTEVHERDVLRAALRAARTRIPPAKRAQVFPSLLRFDGSHFPSAWPSELRADALRALRAAIETETRAPARSPRTHP
jgi:DNA-directed RNA polymerase specialized sigma24 family protein